MITVMPTTLKALSETVLRLVLSVCEDDVSPLRFKLCAVDNQLLLAVDSYHNSWLSRLQLNIVEL